MTIVDSSSKCDERVDVASCDLACQSDGEEVGCGEGEFGGVVEGGGGEAVGEDKAA